MGAFLAAFSRITGFFRHRRSDKTLNAEIQAHLQFFADEHPELSPDEARLAARRAFGGVDQIREAYRDQRSLPMIERLWRDIRIGTRSLMRDRAFAAVSLLTLAMGFAATVVMFTILNEVVLKPLPLPNADRLVRVQAPVPGVRPDAIWNLSTSEYGFFNRASSSIERMGIYVVTAGLLARTPSAPASTTQRVATALVSPEILPLLGAKPVVGRLFTEADDHFDVRSTLAPGVILSYDIWEQRFAKDPTVVGQTIVYEDRAFPVVGVLGPHTELPETAFLPTINIGLWMPLGLDTPPVNQHTFRALALLRPGVTLSHAQAELSALTTRLPEQFPTVYSPSFMQGSRFSTEILPLRDDVLGTVRKWIWLLSAATGLVFLVGLTNVANMFMARRQNRQREIAVRTALGATPRDLFRQLWVESALLSVGAALVGVAAAIGILRGIVALAPTDVPRLGGAHVDAASGALALLGALLAGTFFTVLTVGPRTSMSSADLAQKTPTASRRQTRIKNALVVAQLSLALVLGAGAVLMVQSLTKLLRVPLGFSADRVVAIDVLLPRARYQAESEVVGFDHRLSDVLRADPRVQQVSSATISPLDGNDGCSAIFVEGTGNGPCVGGGRVSPDYFRSLGIAVRGETSDWTTTENGLAGAVLTESLARRLWPGEDAIGKGVRIGRAGPPYYRVVGVTDDVRYGGFDKPPSDMVFFPLQSQPNAPLQGGVPRYLRLLVKASAASTDDVVSRTRDVVRAADPDIAIGDIHALDDLVARSYTSRAFTVWVLAAAAFLTLFISGVGLYGVISYGVSTRRAELGVRLALGAGPAQLRTMVVRETMVIVTVGVMCGITALFALNQVLAAFLFNVSPTDPAALGAIVTAVFAVGIIASAVPAYRASHLDPATVLRCD